MKKLIITVMAVFFVVYHITVFADRILLTGKPLEVLLHPGYFTLPSTATAKHDYLYVTYAGTSRVCYLDTKSELAALDMVQVIFEIEGKKLRWNCYKYNPLYFEIDY